MYTLIITVMEYYSIGVIKNKKGGDQKSEIVPVDLPFLINITVFSGDSWTLAMQSTSENCT